MHRHRPRDISIPGLHRASAEALLGPGRYYGREWHDSEVARRVLADVVEDPEVGLSYFEEIVRLLEQRGVPVVLQ